MAQNVVIDLNADYKQFESALDDLTRKVESTADKMDKSFSFGGEAAKEIKNTSNAVTELSLGLKNISVIAAGKVLADGFEKAYRSIKQVGSEIYQTTARMQSLEMSMKSIVTSDLVKTGQVKDYAEATKQAEAATKDLMGWFKELSLKSPYELTEVMESFKQNANMGQTVDVAKKTTEAILALGAGLGMGQAEMKRFSAALAQTGATGRITAMDLRQFANNGFGMDKMNAIFDILSKKYGILIKDNNDFNKAIEAGKITTDDFFEALNTYALDNYGSAIDQMASTIEGLRSSLKDIKTSAINDIFLETSKTISKTLKPYVEYLMELLTSGDFSAWGEKLNNWVSGLLEPVQKLGEELTNGTFSKAIQSLQDFFSGKSVNLNYFVKLIRDVFGSDVALAFIDKIEQIKGAFEWLKNGLEEIKGKFDFIKNAIGGIALGAGFAYLASFLPTIIEIGGIIAGLVSDLGLIGTIVSTFGAILSSPITLIVLGVTALIEGFAILGQYINFGELLKNTFEIVKNTIMNVAKGIAENVLPKIKGLLETLAPIGVVLAGIVTAVGVAIAGLFNGIIRAIDEILAAVVSGIDFAISLVRLPFDILVGLIKLVVGIITGNGDLIESAVQGVVDRIIHIWESFKSVFENLWKAVEEIAKGAWDVIVGFFKSTELFDEIENIKTSIESVFTGLKKHFEDIINSIINAWHRLTGIMNGEYVTIGDKEVSEKVFTQMQNHYGMEWSYQQALQGGMSPSEFAQNYFENDWNEAKKYYDKYLGKSEEDMLNDFYQSVAEDITRAWQKTKYIYDENGYNTGRYNSASDRKDLLDAFISENYGWAKYDEEIQASIKSVYEKADKLIETESANTKAVEANNSALDENTSATSETTGETGWAKNRSGRTVDKLMSDYMNEQDRMLGEISLTTEELAQEFIANEDQFDDLIAESIANMTTTWGGQTLANALGTRTVSDVDANEFFNADTELPEDLTKKLSDIIADLDILGDIKTLQEENVSEDQFEGIKEDFKKIVDGNDGLSDELKAQWDELISKDTITPDQLSDWMSKYMEELQKQGVTIKQGSDAIESAIKGTSPTADKYSAESRIAYADAVREKYLSVNADGSINYDWKGLSEFIYANGLQTFSSEQFLDYIFGTGLNSGEAGFNNPEVQAAQAKWYQEQLEAAKAAEVEVVIPPEVASQKAGEFFEAIIPTLGEGLEGEGEGFGTELGGVLALLTGTGEFGETGSLADIFDNTLKSAQGLVDYFNGDMTTSVTNLMNLLAVTSEDEAGNITAGGGNTLYTAMGSIFGLLGDIKAATQEVASYWNGILAGAVTKLQMETTPIAVKSFNKIKSAIRGIRDMTLMAIQALEQLISTLEGLEGASIPSVGTGGGGEGGNGGGSTSSENKGSKKQNRGGDRLAGGGTIFPYSTAIVGEHGPEIIRTGSSRLNVFTNTQLMDEIAHTRHALNMLASSAESVYTNRMLGGMSSTSNNDNSQHFENHFGPVIGDKAFRDMVESTVYDVWRREMRLAS